MKASSLTLSVAGLLAALTSNAQTYLKTPFVETTTLTFYWSFGLGYQSNASSPAPAVPDDAVFDPETLPDDYQTYTDTLRVQPYTGPVSGHFAPAGSNSQIINLLLQRAVRQGLLTKQDLTFRWQLIGVREAPKTVRELATNPYRIFLAGQYSLSSSSFPVVEVSQLGAESSVNEPIPLASTVDTGLTLTLGAFSGNYTESNWGAAEDKVRNASGSVATAFAIDFGALYYEDPLHAQDKPTTDPYNYHLKRNYWRASASGLIDYTIRSTPAPLPTFVASTASATGTGWFTHRRDETVYKDGAPEFSDNVLLTYGPYRGIAPLKIAMSTIQYQKRDRFPALQLPSTPSAMSAVADAAPSVTFQWYDTSSNEIRFTLERSVGTQDNWTALATIPTDPDPTHTYGPVSYTDDTVAAGTTYFYRVRAENDNGYSAYSAVRQATTPAAP